MSLEPGTRFGPYEITAQIGAGGMGEVYQATDTRLDRTVAIKVLPAELASDPERRERFEREAKTIAALNHPHICTLHEFDSHEGTDFLVMEHLEGESLQDRLKKGALALDHALEIAIQIADALVKAHRQGITHRDLKPGNIFLTKSGAKLLDFGLAKLTRPADRVTVSSLSTRTEGLTGEGRLLGTVPYMAPEQLEGTNVDTRTDIFAFGATLYEVVTGRRAFSGESHVKLLAAILDVDPPLASTLQRGCPPSLDRTLGKCLRKQPHERWQTAIDLRDELQWIAESFDASHSDGAVGGGSDPRRWRATMVAAGLALLVGGIAGWGWRQTTPTAHPSSGRFIIPFPAGRSASLLDRDTVAISEDGARVVFTVTDARGRTELYARDLDDVAPRLVAENVSAPFLSPDGRWIGVHGSTGILRIPSMGGAPLPVGPLAPGRDIDDAVGRTRLLRGASWQSDDTIVFGTNMPSGLWMLSATSDGSPEEISTPDASVGERNHAWPDPLPNGRGVLFTVIPNGPIENAQIALLDPGSGSHRVLLTGGTHPRYAPTGHIVFGQAGTIRAVGFDLERGEVVGEALTVLEGVTTTASGSAAFDLSRTGTLFYETGAAVPAGHSLVRADRDGRQDPLPEIDRGGFLSVRASPSGALLAVQEQDEFTGNEDIYTYDVTRGTKTRLTTHPGPDATPLWTPDGESLVFASNRGGSWGLYRQRVDGSSEDEQLLVREGVARVMPMGWAANGATLVFMETNPDTRGDIGLLSMDGSRRVEMLLQTDASEGYGSMSPDGRWITYASDRSGDWEVYVERFPDRGQRQQMSGSGGLYPLWSRDGAEIFYYSRDRSSLMAVPVDAGETLTAGLPTRLFGGSPLPWSSPPRPYDETADGRFVTVLTGQGATTPIAPSEMIIVLDWFEELQARVPTP